MNLTQLANLGEFVGGVAVLVTLVYLATELRRSRLATETASVGTLTASVKSLNSDLYLNREMMELFIRGSSEPDSLDPVDRARFLGYTQSGVNHFLTIKRSRDARALPEKEWKVFASGWANFFDSDGGRWALSQVAITPDGLQALLDHRTDASQFAAFKGADAPPGTERGA